METGRVGRVRLEHSLRQRDDGLHFALGEKALLHLNVRVRVAEQNAVGEDDAGASAGPQAAQGVREEQNVFVALLDAQGTLLRSRPRASACKIVLPTKRGRATSADERR